MQEDFDKLKEIGDSYFNHHTYDIAIKYYSSALEFETNEKTYLVHLNRCLTYFKLELYEDALNDAIKASILKPDNAKAWGRVGSCLMALNKDEEALVAFDRAYQLELTNEDYQKLSSIVDVEYEEYDENEESVINEEKNKESVINEEKNEESSQHNMDEMINKLKNMKNTMNSLPIENLMGSLYNKMMNNQKLINLAADDSFRNQMLHYQSNPLEAMKNPKMLDLVGDVLKELDLNKNN